MVWLLTEVIEWQVINGDHRVRRLLTEVIEWQVINGDHRVRRLLTETIESLGY